MSTWYPPTTYDPAAGTGQLLCNPPFAAMTTLPAIHLNGTGADALLREYSAARVAIEAALDAIAAATCNPRDFYPQEPGAWERARAERDEVMRQLKQASDYAAAWQEHAREHLRRAGK
jgi:hypothetical protein